LRLRRLAEFGLADIEAVRLILTGGSVIDWQRLNLGEPADARRFVENHELQLDAPRDRAFIQQVQRESVSYLRRHFNFKIPKPIENAPIEDLLCVASGRGHRQVCACSVLKVLQIINHMAGRELLFRLPVSDRDLFHLVEEKVYRIVGTMLSEGFPITEFIGGRKNLDSTYTKLLSRPEATAAALYDKLRFRIVTRTRDDVLPVLLYLTEQLFPFNYVVPKQSTNTIFDWHALFDRFPNWNESRSKLQTPLDAAFSPNDNRFTAPSYRVVQFVTEVPVRVPPHLMELAPPGSEALGPIVYVLCEFQILDAESEAVNETGDASHDRYKQRQREAVFRRLRAGGRPRGPTSNRG
jgi:uncharacterized protein (TIGR04552 family)